MNKSLSVIISVSSIIFSVLSLCFFLQDEFIDSLILKLKSLGLTELMESQLVNLSSYIVNLYQNGRPHNAFHSSNPKLNHIFPKYQVHPIEDRDKMFLSKCF